MLKAAVPVWLVSTRTEAEHRSEWEEDAGIPCSVPLNPSITFDTKYNQKETKTILKSHTPHKRTCIL